MTSTPGFSSFPAIRMFAPAKVVETIEVNGRPVCAKPRGVTPKWLPIYHELASRMYEGGPSFSIGKNTVDSPITCMVADGNGGWAEYQTPEDAAKAIGPRAGIQGEERAEGRAEDASGLWDRRAGADHRRDPCATREQ